MGAPLHARRQLGYCSRLGSGGTSESYVDVTFAPDGTALAVWAQDDEGSSRICFNRYTPQNRRGTAAIIRPELSAQLDEYAPQLAFDSTGKALMVFHVTELLDATDPDELPRSHFSAWAMRYTAVCARRGICGANEISC